MNGPKYSLQSSPKVRDVYAGHGVTASFFFETSSELEHGPTLG